MIRNRLPLLTLFALVLTTPSAEASFHWMQIEQVIGGVCGDTTQQAIQLRMRFGGQNQIQFSRLVVRDAAGANAIVLIDFTSQVPIGAAGSRVLSQSAAFDSEQVPEEDRLLTNVIPATYLPAGRLTFEDDGANILWSLSWGGAAYTGSTTGTMDNDADGIFGPSFPGPLPWTSHKALLFDGAAGDLSTNNAADYIVTLGQAQFTNNAGASGNVVPADCIFADFFETGGPHAWLVGP